MQRFNHKIKPNHSTEGPSSLVFFDTETWPYCETSETNTIRHKLRLGVAIYVRYHKGKTSRREVFYFRQSKHFWEWIESKLSTSRPLYVFAHNLLFDFRIVGGFDVIQSNDSRQWRYILRNAPNIISGRMVGKSIHFVDTLNYVRDSLYSVGKSFGLPKLQMPAFTANESDWFDYCLRDVEIIERVIITIRGYLEDNNCGVFKRTISGCSYHAWKHRFYERPIYIHDSDYAINLEGMSYYGGRSECYRAGTIGGPVYMLDINSLYPYVMKTFPLPYKLVKILDNPPIEYVHDRLQSMACCAQVIVDTKDPYYPKKVNDKTCYPIGTYRTWLCAPELKLALDLGHVYKIQKVAFYEHTIMFRSFVEFFHSQRLEWRRQGNYAMETVAKLLLNSLSGKFAQRAPKWIERPEVKCYDDWGIFGKWDMISQSTTWYRAIADLAQEELRSDFGPDAFPAISGHITSYARTLMEAYKDVAGRENVYYMDTDSLMVNTDGLDRLLLRRLIHPTELGLFKLVSIGDYARINGVKDLSIGGKTVMSAIKRSATKQEDGCYKQWVWDGVQEMLRSKGSSSVAQVERVIRLAHATVKSRTNPDGTVRPVECFELLDLV